MAMTNELDMIIETLRGVDDEMADGIMRARAAQNGSPGVFSDPAGPGDVVSFSEMIERFGFSKDGPGEFANGAAFLFSGTVEAYQLSKEAIEKTKYIYGRSGANDTSDAFRHGYWSFRMQQDIGFEKAKKFSNAHERGWFSDYYNGSLSSGSTSADNRDPGELLMDLFNNSRGRSLYRRHMNDRSLESDIVAKIIKDAIDRGELRLRPFLVTR
jgi:hypothetical protein